MAVKLPQTRVTFHDSPDLERVAANLYVGLVPPTEHGVLNLVLLHDYPDFRPGLGWRVLCGGVQYTVIGVDGLTVRCAEVQN